MAYQEIVHVLVENGLSPDQADIYSYLVHNGQQEALVIGKGCNKKPGLTYKVLGQLVDLGYVDKLPAGGQKSVYLARDPKRLIEEKEQEIHEKKSDFQKLKAIHAILEKSFKSSLKLPLVETVTGEILPDVIQQDFTEAKVFSVLDKKLAKETTLHVKGDSFLFSVEDNRSFGLKVTQTDMAALLSKLLDN